MKKLALFLITVSVSMVTYAQPHFPKVRSSGLNDHTLLTDTDTAQFWKKRKNIVSMELLLIIPTFNYERNFFITDKIRLAARAGFGFYGGDTFINAGGNLKIGPQKHSGFVELLFVGIDDDDIGEKVLTAGYSYVAEKGFAFKAGIGIVDSEPLLVFGLGYAFKLTL